jgi:tyrosinase
MKRATDRRIAVHGELSAIDSKRFVGGVGCASRRPSSRPLVRISVGKFSKDEKKLASFRRGVERMRNLDPTHPFSWIFQANIHGRPTFPAYVVEQANACDAPVALRLFRDKPSFNPDPNVFSQCPHGNWWFFPWHRAYVYYFERIVRWAACDDQLALPYWNYSDPAQRQIPEAYRQAEINGDPNPLYLPDNVTVRDPMGSEQTFAMRSSALNSGNAQLSAGSTNLDALTKIPFTTSPGVLPGDTFGSARADSQQQRRGYGALENVPHNVDSGARSHILAAPL